MSDEVPNKEDIEWFMRLVHTNYAGGTLGVWLDHLNIWLAMAWTKENPDPSRCQTVVNIIQLTFDTRELAMECTWNTAVLLPKVGG